jgi:uncharacterized RDD family membrane protein YckC
MSDYDPSTPGGDQSWGTPQPPGSQPGSGWGPPPGTGPPPGGQPYGGQQLPPYSQFGSQESNWAPPTQSGTQLAEWGPRAGAFLIDWLIIFVPSLILDVLASATKAGFFVFLGYVWGIGMWVWFSVQVGRSGNSPGMRVVGLKCVNKNTGQTIGPGMAIVRWLLHILDSLICFIGWFMPLWDSQRQTLSDKIVSTYVYREPAQGFSLTPKSTR